MKTIGVIGGMSWESSAEYYRQINEITKAKLGPTHSAKLIMYSLDFHPVAVLELAERWDELAALLIEVTGKLEKAGADFVIMASNKVHRVAETVERSISIPLLHIADATAEEIALSGIHNIGLLGTRFVMEQDFYRARLRAHGLKVLIPDEAARLDVHDIIYDELCAGQILPKSKQRVLAIIRDLEQAGAQAVALACTELPLLIRTEDSIVKLFDTMAIHARKAVELALAE